MKRPTLAVKFIVRGHRFVYVKVDSIEKCEDGEEWFGGLTYSKGGPHIGPDGRFAEREEASEFEAPRKGLLSGRINGDLITGIYLSSYDEEGHQGRVEELLESCGSGEPKGRVMHFTARRVKG